MRVDFLKSFSKDLDSINQKSTRDAIVKSITLIEKAESIWEIPHIKKLSGHRNAYRIRLGDYRIGIFVEENIVQFAHVLHRKEIYKMFP